MAENIPRYKLVNLAKKFNKSHRRKAMEPMTINQFHDRMKVLAQHVRAEMDAHRRHRKEVRESVE